MSSISKSMSWAVILAALIATLGFGSTASAQSNDQISRMTRQNIAQLVERTRVAIRNIGENTTRAMIAAKQAGASDEEIRQIAARGLNSVRTRAADGVQSVNDRAQRGIADLTPPAPTQTREIRGAANDGIRSIHAAADQTRDRISLLARQLTRGTGGGGGGGGGA
jgi:hypothetical protein